MKENKILYLNSVSQCFWTTNFIVLYRACKRNVFSLKIFFPSYSYTVKSRILISLILIFHISIKKLQFTCDLNITASPPQITITHSHISNQMARISNTDVFCLLASKQTVYGDAIFLIALPSSGSLVYP